MSKKVKAIIWGSVAILILVAAVIALLLIPKAEDPVDSELSSFNDSLIELIYEQSEDVESIAVKNQKDEYTIELVGEDLWRVRDIMDFKQTEYLYLETLSQVSNIVATSVVEENATDLSKFGFDNPRLVLDVKYNNGNEYHLTIGSISPDQRTQYVIKTGENTVYGVPSTNLKNLYYTRYIYTDKTVVDAFNTNDAASIPQIYRVEITRPDLEKPIILERMTEDELAGGTQANIHMTSPVTALLAETPLNTQVFGYFGMTATDVAKAKLTDEDKKEFGFDTPSATVLIQYNETSEFKLIIGKKTRGMSLPNENGYTEEVDCYYVMREGVDQAYVVPAEYIFCMTLQPKDIISSAIVLPGILEISSIEVKLDNKDYELVFTPGEDPKDANQITAAFNGKEADLENAKSYMQLLNLTAVQDINLKEPTTKAVLTIIYHYKSGKTDTVEYFVDEQRNTIVSLNGNNAYIGRATQVEKVRQETQNFLEGKTVDVDL